MSKLNKKDPDVIASAAFLTGVVVVGYIVLKRKHNRELVALANVASNAVTNWIAENKQAGFHTYLLTDGMIDYIQSLTNNALLPAAVSA